MGTIRILAVDDDRQILRLLQRALAPVVEVVACLTAEEALSILHEDRAFAAILCDMHLGDSDGTTFFSTLARMAPELAPRVAFLTGGATTSSMAHFLDHTPNNVFAKPFNFTAIAEFIQERAQLRSAGRGAVARDELQVRGTVPLSLMPHTSGPHSSV